MPQEINYEERLEELKTRETEIRQRLAEIAEERTTKMGDAAEVYGVSATEVDLGNDEERQNLQDELDQNLNDQKEIFEARRQEKISADKQKREERQTEINKQGKLQQAFKFFTYLDTATTQGYNLDGLTEDEVINLYDDFMTKPEYEQIKRETLDKAMKNDREIVIPTLKQEEQSVEIDEAAQIEELKAREAEIRQRLAEIAEERTASMNDAAGVFGVNATEVDLGVSEERKQLQAELDTILDKLALLEGVKGIDYINARKDAAAEKREQMSRQGKLEQAYKFFTYLDTATTQGYNLDGLTEDEIINLYDDFMTKPEYEQIKRETLDRAMKNDREIVIPKLPTNEIEEQPRDILEITDEQKRIIKEQASDEDKAIIDSLISKPMEISPVEEVEEPEISKPRVLMGKIKSAPTKLVEKWKNLSKKKKIAIIVGAVVVAGVVVASAIHAAITGDASAIAHASQVDISSVIGNTADQMAGYGIDAIPQTAAGAADTVQMFDNSVDLSQGAEIFNNAYDAAAGTNGVESAVDQAYVGDLFNTTTGEYGNIDPSNLTMDQLQELKAQGFDSGVLTTDPNMVGQGGNTIAEANAATGHIKL